MLTHFDLFFIFRTDRNTLNSLPRSPSLYQCLSSSHEEARCSSIFIMGIVDDDSLISFWTDTSDKSTSSSFNHSALNISPCMDNKCHQFSLSFVSQHNTIIMDHHKLYSSATPESIWGWMDDGKAPELHNITKTIYIGRILCGWAAFGDWLWPRSRCRCCWICFFNMICETTYRRQIRW